MNNAHCMLSYITCRHPFNIKYDNYMIIYLYFYNFHYLIFSQTYRYLLQNNKNLNLYIIIKIIIRYVYLKKNFMKYFYIAANFLNLKM